MSSSIHVPKGCKTTTGIRGNKNLPCRHTENVCEESNDAEQARDHACEHLYLSFCQNAIVFIVFVDFSLKRLFVI